MPDPNVQLSNDEQNYFDTRGEETVDAPKVEAPKVEETTVATEPKIAKKQSRISKSETVSEPVENEQPVVTKTPHEEQIENLNIALKQERQEAKERDRRTEERLRLLQSVVEQRQAPQVQQQQETIPDVDKDPLGTLKYVVGKIRQGDQTQQQTQQQQQEQFYRQQIVGEASRMEAEFLSQQPDFDASTRTSPTYNEASNFLVTMRKAELTATGSYNPMQINQILVNETVELARQSLQNGRNPAQVIYDIAKARGFAPKAKAAPQETESEKISRIAKGQEAGFSLSQAGGSKAPANKGLDAKSLATMSEDDFNSFMAKAKKSELRSLFGD